MAISNSSSSSIPSPFSLLHKLSTSCGILNTHLASSGEIKDIAEVPLFRLFISLQYIFGLRKNIYILFFSWSFVFLMLDNKIHSAFLNKEFFENNKRHLPIYKVVWRVWVLVALVVFLTSSSSPAPPWAHSDGASLPPCSQPLPPKARIWKLVSPWRNQRSQKDYDAFLPASWPLQGRGEIMGKLTALPTCYLPWALSLS